MKYIWKAQIVDHKDIVIDMHDRAYQFGDGIYEVIRIYNGILFTPKEHIDRLFQGAAKIEMEVSFTKQQLHCLIEELVRQNQVYTGYIYLQVSRGDGIERNHHFPSVEQSQPVLSGFTKVMERNEQLCRNGVATITIPDQRWLKCDIKTISLMGNVLAKNEAAKAHVHEVIQHRDGIVTECASSNVFLVKDGVVYTHPNGHLILPGITKIVISQCASRLGITVKEEAFTVADLSTADELFLSSTTSEIIPIVRVDYQDVNDGKRGCVTQRLQVAFDEEVAKVCR